MCTRARPWACRCVTVYIIEVGAAYEHGTCTCTYCTSSTCEQSSTTYRAENITWTEKLTPITVEGFKKTPGPKVIIPQSARGHSMSNQHAKLTPITDFAETC